MVTINEEKLIIEISHPCPKEFLIDLKQAIIESLQNQSEEPLNQEQVQQSNYILLEVLKNLL